MAEEEAGFTFVDKRRMQVEPSLATPMEASDPSQESSAEDWGAAETSDGTESVGAPSTYDLIGYCINLLASQAWQKMGLLADPQTGEARPDLAEAKVAIDTVNDLAARLESAPEASVPAAMRRELRTLLNDLRLNYVSQRGQISGSAASGPNLIIP